MVLVVSLLMIPFVLFPLALLGPKYAFIRHWFYKASSAYSHLLLAIAGLRYQVVGSLPSSSQTPAIIIMNHSSSIDIPLLEALMNGTPFVWLSKASYGRIPIAGIILRRMHVAVNRQALRQASKSLDLFIAKAKAFNAHMLIFPEGTRHSDGHIHPFKQGFAVAQEQTQWPIIPIVAQNLHTILPRHGLLIDSSSKTIKIIIGKPLQRMIDESREAFVLRAQEACTTLLNTNF